MLNNNEVFKDYLKLWDGEVEAILERFPEYIKYNLKPKLIETMNKYSPARRTKSILEFKEKNKYKFPIDDLNLT